MVDVDGFLSSFYFLDWEIPVPVLTIASRILAFVFLAISVALFVLGVGATVSTGVSTFR